MHTAWLRPDSVYEEGYLQFVDRILAQPENNEFLQNLRPFQQKIAEYGVYNSLAQVLLKNASPGVPDLYQGCELWDLSLVDPDNRRPVSYEQRMEMLQKLRSQTNSDVLSLIDDLFVNQFDGRIKLFLTMQLLQARKSHRELFLQGDYQPLNVTGTFADHLIAFARTHAGKTAIALAPRFLSQVVKPGERAVGKDVWQDTQVALPSGMPAVWQNVITSEQVSSDRNLLVGAAFQHFPVALLISG